MRVPLAQAKEAAMKADRPGARVAILLGLAVLAALFWLATLLGLGKQVSPRDASGIVHPSLPSLAAAVPDAMIAPGSFAAVTERPVFATDRRPHPFRLGGPEAATHATLRLTGVLLAGDFGMATLTSEQDRSLRLRLNGEAVEGWQLLALEPRRATVLGPDGAQVLELAVFDGQGGEPPTQLRDPRAPQAGFVAPVQPPSQPSGRAAVGERQQAVPPAAPAADAPAAPNQGPSEERMREIRERIRARREQLKQQQSQSTPPPGGAANP